MAEGPGDDYASSYADVSGWCWVYRDGRWMLVPAQ